MAKSLAKRKETADSAEQEKISLSDRLKRLYRILQKEKPEKKKAYRPRGYRARKLGVWLFWILLVLILLVGNATLNAVKSSKAVATPAEQVITLNPATTTTAVQYAQNFAKEYFTWKPDDKSLANRKERLLPYLAKGMDEQAGLQVNGLKTTSVLTKTEIKNIEEKGPKEAYVTLKVYQKVGIPKEITKTNKKTKQTKVVSVKYEPKEVTKFFVVPVGYYENFGIYDLPKFTYIDPQTTLELADRTKGMDEVQDSAAKENVRNFLDTFFDSYTQDSRDKLAYLLEDPEHPNGLNKRMKFVSVYSASIYQGNAPTNYIVHTTVMMEDPDTKDKYKTNYSLNVTQKDARYVVTKIDEQ